MNEPELPDDLLALEARLRGRTPAAPPAALRARVLGAVAREAAFERRVRWTSLAASALVALGLWSALPEHAAQHERSAAAPAARELALLESAGIDPALVRRWSQATITPLAAPLKGS